MPRFCWVAYIIATALWNILFTALAVIILDIVYSIIGHNLLGRSDIVLMYAVGYVAWFLLNIRIIDDDDF